MNVIDLFNQSVEYLAIEREYSEQRYQFLPGPIPTALPNECYALPPSDLFNMAHNYAENRRRMNNFYNYLERKRLDPLAGC